MEAGAAEFDMSCERADHHDVARMVVVEGWHATLPGWWLRRAAVSRATEDGGDRGLTGHSDKMAANMAATW